jgi:hypothetical protein
MPVPKKKPSGKRYFHPTIKSVQRDEKNDKRRRIIGVASTDVLDRADEWINQKGWDLKNFKKNPVFLWAHNSSELPIGTIDVIKVEDNQLIYEAVESLANPFSKSVFDMYEASELKATSVGFICNEYKFYDADGKEVDDWYDASQTELAKNELLEISAVPVPCNPEALQLMFQKGLDLEVPAEPARIVGYDESRVDMEQAIKSIVNIFEKEGRVLSGKNRSLINDAVTALQSLLDATDTSTDDDDKAAPDWTEPTPNFEIVESLSDGTYAYRFDPEWMEAKHAMNADAYAMYEAAKQEKITRLEKEKTSLLNAIAHYQATIKLLRQ